MAIKLDYLFTEFGDRLFDCNFLDKLYNFYAFLEQQSANFYTIYFPGLIVFFIETLLAISLSRRAPQIFVDLEKAGRFSPRASYKPSRWMPESPEEFSKKMLETLYSPWRYVLGVVFAGIILYLYTHYNQFPLIAQSFQSGFWPMAVNNVNIMIVMTVGVCYYASYVLWMMIIISVYISYLPRVFDINYAFHHPDGCAGLKRLGSLCLNMAIMIILPTLILSAWQINGLYVNVWQLWLDLTYVAIFFMLAFSLMVFIWPVLTIHEEMKREAESHQDNVMVKIESIKTEIYTLLQTTTAQEAADANPNIDVLQQKIDHIRTVERLDESPPTWPFDTSIFLQFSIPQILPILTLLSTYFKNDKLTTLLDNLSNLIP
jgi:hypothetical protein